MNAECGMMNPGGGLRFIRLHCAWGLGVLALLWGVTWAAEGPATRPAPGVMEQLRARKLVGETFQKEYAATGWAARLALARKLYQQALQTQDDAAARYVLLSDARDIAAEAGDGELAGRAVGTLVRDFGGDEMKLLVGALKKAAETERHEGTEARRHEGGDSDALISGTLRTALAAVDRAIRGDDYVSAAQLMAVASEAARKSSSSARLSQLVDERRRELETLRKEFERVQVARKVLVERPDDPEANLTVGRYGCWVKGDFHTGLPLLAKGSDATLKGLAKREMAGASEVQEKLGIANLWWDLAQGQRGTVHQNLERHAGELYRSIVDHLSGLNRSLVEKRLESLDAEALQEQNLEPGLVAELFRGTGLDQKVKTRIDPQIDFDWGEAAADAALPKDSFSIRWSGVLRVAAGGQHQIVVIANTGVRLWIDEKLVLDNENLARHRNGVRTPVQLGAGVHTLKVEYWDTSGIARMRLLWQRPGAGKDEPIPAGVFYHDGLLNSSPASN